MKEREPIVKDISDSNFCEDQRQTRLERIKARKKEVFRSGDMGLRLSTEEGRHRGRRLDTIGKDRRNWIGLQP